MVTVAVFFKDLPYSKQSRFFGSYPPMQGLLRGKYDSLSPLLCHFRYIRTIKNCSAPFCLDTDQPFQGYIQQKILNYGLGFGQFFFHLWDIFHAYSFDYILFSQINPQNVQEKILNESQYLLFAAVLSSFQAYCLLSDILLRFILRLDVHRLAAIGALCVIILCSVMEVIYTLLDISAVLPFV